VCVLGLSTGVLLDQRVHILLSLGIEHGLAKGLVLEVGRPEGVFGELI